MALIEPERAEWFKPNSGYPAAPDDPSAYWRGDEAVRARMERELLDALTSDERPSRSSP